MHHGDDLAEHRTREATFGAQCTNRGLISLVSFVILGNLSYNGINIIQNLFLFVVPNNEKF